MTKYFQLEYSIVGCTVDDVLTTLEKQDGIQEFTISTREDKLLVDLPPDQDTYKSTQKIRAIIDTCLQGKVSEASS